jgi:TRAP-type transport system small permease protein
VKTIFNILDSALRYGIGLCMAGIMLAVGLQVVARATIGAFSWPEELSVILMIWGLMLAAAYVLNERGHVGITILVDRLGARTGAAISALMHLLIIIFSAAVIYGAYFKINSVWNLTTGGLGISRAIPNLAIPTSCALFILVSVRLMLIDLAHWKAAR